MGTYIDLTDVERQLPALYERFYQDPDTEAVNTEWVTADITAVEATIHAKLAVRYQVPISSPTWAVQQIQTWAIDLLTERAYERGQSVPEHIKAKADRVRAELSAIAKGNAALAFVAEPEEEPEDSAAGAVLIDNNDPVMTRDELKGY